jgi:hypothetical protein
MMNLPKKVTCCFCFVLLVISPRTARAQVIDSEVFSLSIHATGPGFARISWPITAGNAALQSSDHLTGSVWTSVNAATDSTGEEISVTIPVADSTRFYRLAAAQVTTIRETSPVSGETGVAVTRETVVHFSAPLSTNASINTSNFFAGFGGRRILSRAELSSDRTKATLFYLEPLPGSARVVVVFDGSLVNGANGQAVDADGDGTPGGQGIITFDTLSLTTLPNTAVIGTVYASELVPGTDTGTNALNKPLAGVTITVDGMEQTLRAVTDANGNFKLSPVPPGRFFVHIDGRTVSDASANIHYPDKSYYPFVGKAWDAVAGREDNLAGGNGKIYLPLITAGTLQPVSMTSDTVITFPPSVVSNNPALAGVSITVPANSLFSENGTRGGKVGIAAVPPDRLPGPLPPGLELPIVITVQTDGALNFDQPAPICFPNLPDPVLKTPPPAGTKQALISFNHDKGIWEAVGSMTVSADGKLICTDPGAGILQPGWHGVGPQPDEPPPPRCPGEDSQPVLAASLRSYARDAVSPIRTLRMATQDGDGGNACPPGCEQSNEAALDCVIHCEEILRACRVRALRYQVELKLACFNAPEHLVALCLRGALLRYLEFIDACNDANSACFKQCSKCFGNIKPTGLGSLQLQPLPVSQQALANAPVPAVPALEQISSFLEEVVQLMLPFAASLSPIPSDVLTQVEQLYEKADAVAGGDALAFLTRETLAVEEMNAAAMRALGLDADDLSLGNAPGYPVLYAARVVRPNGQLVLRGETGPFGQYSLFVPRDGSLLDVSFYDPRTKRSGLITPNLSPNAPYRLPRFVLAALASDSPDFDADGLPNVIEEVFGTDPTKADTDGDGIFDGAEVDQRTNPLDGVPVRIGIIGTAKTPGGALDVAAANDLLAVAEGTSGVSIFNINNGMSPVLIAQVDTPGNAQAVAMSGNYVAVADGDYGLTVIDASDPAQARVVHQLPLGGNSLTVAAAGNACFVGTIGPAFDGFRCTLVKVDLVTGLPMGQIVVGNGIRTLDLAIAGDQIYVLTDSTLFIFGESNSGLVLLGQLTVSGEPGQKIFAGGGLAYVGNATAYYVIDVSNPATPTIIGRSFAPQLGLHDVIATGSGTLLGTGSVMGPVRFQIALFDSSVPTNVTKFLTLLDTPGDAQGLTIYNGFAYIADSSAGIQVLNYQPFDKNGIAPSVSLTSSAVNGMAEQARPMRATANATDDVQVRNVEFYIDGQKTFTDGNFPFDYVFDAPALTATKTNFTLRARAVDTGGNATWSEEIKVALGPDVTPPYVLRATPVGGARAVASLQVFFSEPIAPASVNSSSFQLFSAGPDGLIDTGDDAPIGGSAVNYHAQSRSASLELATPLPEGIYKAAIRSNVMDVAENFMADNYSWQFRVANGIFWSRRTDGFWEDDSNWSTGRVPGPDETIYIESISGDVTVTHRNGMRTIKKLVVEERVVLNGGLEGATWQISDTIEIRGTLMLHGATLKGGVVKQIGDGALVASTDGRNTLDGVSVIGDLKLTNHIARLVIRNGLSLTGTLFLDDLGYITFAGDQTFDNAQVVFGESGQFQLTPGTTLTLGPQMLLRGKSGQIGQGDFGTRKMINRGRISADVVGGTFNIAATHFENQGTLECSNGGKVTIIDGLLNNTGQIKTMSAGALTLGGAWTNRGTLSVSEATLNLGGTFKLVDLGTLNRTGGTINLTGLLDLNGETLTLNSTTGPWVMNGGTLKGGTVKQTDEGKLLFTLPHAMNTFDAMRVEGDLVLTNTSTRALIRNGLELNGAAILEHAGAITFAGNQTFSIGQIVFGSTAGILGIEPGTTLTLGPTIVVRGKNGFIGNGVFTSFGFRKLINQGTISANVPGATLVISPEQFENSGTLRADGAGATLTIRANPFTNNGTTNELNGGRINVIP